MRRMPILDRNRFLWSPGDVSRRRYAVLDGISSAYPPVKGRLHTCYSPVRRSPADGPRSIPAAPRLACVKPVASVHAEPGSNSPLLFILFLSFFKSKTRQLLLFVCCLHGQMLHPSRSAIIGSGRLLCFLNAESKIDRELLCSLVLLRLWQSFQCSLFALRPRLRPEQLCKGRANF